MGYEKPGSSRTIAFAAIVFSTVAITGCLLTFPLIFHYVQTLEASVQVELDFCKTRSRAMWREMLDIQGQPQGNGRFINAMNLARARRATAKEDTPAVAESQPQASQGGLGQCCTCHRGVAGPAGGPGPDGHDGVDGFAGEPGDRGSPAATIPDLSGFPQEQCPCVSAPGDGGAQGPKGADGAPGEAGPAGGDGQPGGPGPAGPPGPAGAPGNAGAAGPAGDAGKVTQGGAGPAGPAGPNGKPGAAGPAGQPGGPGKDGGPGAAGGAGDAGAPGGAGKAGGPGAAGEPGKPGAPGSCEHCPPARLAPGY